MTIITPEGLHHTVQGPDDGPQAQFILHDWSVIDGMVKGGDIALAESYRLGQWDSDNLPALLTLAVLNAECLEAYFHGKLGWRIVHWLRHITRPNSRVGSKRNIMAHYDLGNTFYSQWLDPSMTYSAALFDHVPDDTTMLQDEPTDDLLAAQHAKYDRMLDRIGDRPQHILEIGCGWGGFAERAIERGHRLTCLTISPAQAAFARARLASHINRGEVEIREQDYRETTGQYDAIVSIEMFEAVGERYWPGYFKQIKRLLAPHGTAMIQTITIDDTIFRHYRKRSDMIREYIFPGGMLPSPSVFTQKAHRAGLSVRHGFAFGRHYAYTLKYWLSEVEKITDSLASQGYDERFQRLWHFYLAFCMAGFLSGRTDVMQFELRHD